MNSNKNLTAKALWVAAFVTGTAVAASLAIVALVVGVPETALTLVFAALFSALFSCLSIIDLRREVSDYRWANRR